MKTIKIFLVVMALIAVPMVGNACQALRAHGMDETQIGLLHQAHEYAEPYGWGLTLAAIAWKESSGGKYLINLQDPSVGPFHVTVDKVVRHLGWSDTPYNRNRAAQIAMSDFEMTAHIAVMELAYWNIQRGRQWRDTVISYNAGNNLNNPRGKLYGSDIASKVMLLKTCEW